MKLPTTAMPTSWSCWTSSRYLSTGLKLLPIFASCAGEMLSSPTKRALHPALAASAISSGLLSIVVEAWLIKDLPRSAQRSNRRLA